MLVLCLLLLAAATTSVFGANPDVVRTCSGVCEIRIRYADPSILSLGSGFLVDRDEGLIVTNFHVISGGVRGDLSFEGQENQIAFDVVGYSVSSDLAILRIDADAFQKELSGVWEFSLSPDPPVAATGVFAIGYPAGLGFTVNEGIVNAVRVWGTQIDPNGKYSSYGIDPASRWIVHDCGTRGGNSGGPLVDSRGRVLGVNTFGIEGAVPPIDLASPIAGVRELLRGVSPESGVGWRAIEGLADAVADDLKVWSVPDVEVPATSAASTMTSIRALPRVAACPKCNGDGDVSYQRTIRSGHPYKAGEIIKGNKICDRCGGDGYNRDWTRVSKVLESLTRKIAGMDPDDRRYEQASEQFFAQLAAVMIHTPSNWAKLVNADCFTRLERPRTREAIFGVGACSWTFEMNGLGTVTLVVPAVTSDMVKTSYFIMIDPVLDNRTVDEIQYAFWGGIIADVQEFVDDTKVIFIRKGFVMADPRR
ncbi:trypsin-like peptidase domain-containing protein [bacterium]|nr:trypsin-like peptidase domain-containing protein [bacterium]